MGGSPVLIVVVEVDLISALALRFDLGLEGIDVGYIVEI